MKHWPKPFLALAMLLLTGCLWGPGKFTSDLTLKKGGSFVLDYKGEIVLQMPPDEGPNSLPWSAAFARCYSDGRAERVPGAYPFEAKPSEVKDPDTDEDDRRPCSPAELAKLKTEYEKEAVERAASKRKENEEMAKAFGLPGLDDESNRAFAAKLMKYVGWRSVRYRGKGVFDVDYHFEGRATQDFLFPALPDNDVVIPFIAIRRRADGAVLVTAPAMTGGAGPIAARAGSAAAGAMKGGPVSRAQGRFTNLTDGEVLTNNSEDGATRTAAGQRLSWDVTPASNKIPETLIRL